MEERIPILLMVTHPGKIGARTAGGNVIMDFGGQKFAYFGARYDMANGWRGTNGQHRLGIRRDPTSVATSKHLEKTPREPCSRNFLSLPPKEYRKWGAHDQFP